MVILDKRSSATYKVRFTRPSAKLLTGATPFRRMPLSHSGTLPHVALLPTAAAASTAILSAPEPVSMAALLPSMDDVDIRNVSMNLGNASRETQWREHLSVPFNVAIRLPFLVLPVKMFFYLS